MEPGAYAPKHRFPSCLRHTHQVSAIKTSGHLMTHSTSRQEGLGVRLLSLPCHGAFGHLRRFAKYIVAAVTYRK
jgi:hypothetical protein